MLLSDRQVCEFDNCGWMQIPQVIPKGVIANTLLEVPTERLQPEYDSKKLSAAEFSPNMTHLCEMVRPYANQLLKREAEIVEAMYSVMLENSGGFGGGAHWHLDGFGRIHSGGSWNDLPFFQLFIGIFLTELPSGEMGNLMVVDGGHRIISDWFKKTGKAEFDRNLHLDDPTGLVKKCRQMSMPLLKPVLVSSGDVVICHSLLPHSVDVNNGPRRPVVYFRFGTPRLQGIEALSNPWSCRS